MFKQCCISGCNQDGREKLSKIEGKVLIKPEFINSCPRDWLLCQTHFVENAEKLDCCIERCSNTASTNEIPPEMYGKVKVRPNCSHHLICLNHFKRYSTNKTPRGKTHKAVVPNLPPIKREPPPQPELQPPEKMKIKQEQPQNFDDDSATAEEPLPKEMVNDAGIK
ncbi:hypothetical protein EIN_180040 [Entamoeba invadens IP1]|uniref:hypothetical protein n=1 Tax=Entamoeba invadens IP1 TaxID=370355 RepID=UPI0002C3F627|nr:hypothetical protein EIN_180040 [Entamoeba invadens IP1]ELP93947.1 hypothetical protein EIN_180040 [Entamoeba invadens IP1]|eukprot:XP_004260718.1 hypothetical protein EIN_180040 [Entamoeba invadens IP1]